MPLLSGIRTTSEPDRTHIRTDEAEMEGRHDIRYFEGGNVADGTGYDDDDSPDAIIWDYSGGNVASSRSQGTEGGLPDIVVRDDDDGSAQADDDDAPPVIFWDLSGGNATPDASGDVDDVDLPDTIIWDLDGGSVASSRSQDAEGGLPDIVVRDDDDDSAPADDDDAPPVIFWDLSGGTVTPNASGDDDVDISDGNRTTQWNHGINDDQRVELPDYDVFMDQFVFSLNFLDIRLDESLMQNVIAMDGDGGNELWADLKDTGPMQTAFVEDLTGTQIQAELSEASFI
ncbi:hypothetical protein IWQ55_004058 [Labrenzia sp. EL_208]|nr:hypothetical protein [Labrenzia sp. EL_132]MBG6230834.1 hypothetical protein [Labrenzia sp. EL_208]